MVAVHLGFSLYRPTYVKVFRLEMRLFFFEQRLKSPMRHLVSAWIVGCYHTDG